MAATKEKPPWAVSGRLFYRRLRPSYPVTLTLPTATRAPDARESFRSSCVHTGRRVLPEPRGDVQDMAADPIVIA